MTGRRIAVTGALGYLAKGLIERLEQNASVEYILLLDVRPPNRDFSDKTVFYKRSINEQLDDLLAENAIDLVVHLAFVLNPGKREANARRVNVDGTANLINACLNAKVGYMLYLSSTSVYGARPENSPLLTEDCPTRPLAGFQYSEDKALAESLISEASLNHPDFRTTILRVCPVMGPNANNFIADAFSKPFLVGVKGYDPTMQLLHENDLTDAMSNCLMSMTPGVYNIAPDDSIQWREMARMYQRKLITLPAPILHSIVSLTWSLGIQSDSPPSGLNFIKYPINASTERAKRILGFKPKYTSKEAWQAFVNRDSQQALKSGAAS